jgi:hypothetical protein
MVKEQVHETIIQLVKSYFDQRQALTRLRNFQDASDPPQAPSEFEKIGSPGRTRIKIAPRPTQP